MSLKFPFLRQSLFTLLILAAQTTQADSQPAVFAELAKLADDVAIKLQTVASPKNINRPRDFDPNSPITVSVRTGTDVAPVSAGYQLAFSEALQKRGFNIDSKAALTLQVDIRNVPARDLIRFEFRLMDAQKNQLGETLVDSLQSTESLARDNEVSLETNSSDTAKVQQGKITQLALKPGGSPPAIDAATNRILPTATSRFGIEIRRVLPGKPGVAEEERDTEAITPTEVQGKTFVAIPSQAEYEIWLWNDTDDDMLVELFIDGVNTLAFSTDVKPLNFWRLDKHSQREIKGWRTNAQEASRFKQTNDFKQFARTKLGLQVDSAVGVINAVFRKGNVKKEFPATQRGSGFGETVRVPSELSLFYYSNPIGFLSLRYER
jgi:hypothetical protein